MVCLDKLRGYSQPTLLAAAFTFSLVAAQQPLKHGIPGTFEIVGNSGVSAQQMFLGTPNKVYILDKTENNPISVAGHPAWATEYDIDTNEFRTMDIMSNTFCAGGGVMGDGTWLVVGGNQAVKAGGLNADSQTGGGPYGNTDGGKAIRFLTPCSNKTCNWVDDPARYMPTRRWYATLETVEDGSLIIIGGNTFGGFVTALDQNNPTYEFYPPRGDLVGLNILKETLPANLFPLTWLLPSGNLFIQTNWGTGIFDYKRAQEFRLSDIPGAVRTYPASGATAILPLTPANNYTATLLFCGGSDLQPDQWVENWNIAQYPASASCVSMTPDVSAAWKTEESLPLGRSMSNFIMLPNQKLFLTSGANTGVSGYGNTSWAIGHSYADHPLLKPLIFDPLAPAGSRFSSDGLSASTIPRMYHSTATLLPDGSVFIAGSNPNQDYTVGPGVLYPTEYRTERFYPDYYSSRRPEPQGVPTQLSYGGPYFNVSLAASDLPSPDDIQSTNVVIIRTGFATHAINHGQRLLQLNSTYTLQDDGSAILHVSQMPTNPAIFAPGPAFLFVVVKGVPSIGRQIMVGSGKIETQPILPAPILPGSYNPLRRTSKPKSGLSTGVPIISTNVLWVAIVSASIAFFTIS